MIHKSTTNTVDAYPGLSSIERQALFFQSRHASLIERLAGTVSQLRYMELVREHFTLLKK